ncbi:TIGR02221 family CRISPR-associated protein [Ectothiorhodospira lacustris]|uniref:TIGR02221 family CRISPR-associated protein n=1 Tax=Ectothiorhodospira lacustris TaxID=2899127 RepID=UPI001EE90ACE|nr:TIGR02221 family CRISPR-associated protein [Ectothiorhodospira lacustris]MCG5501539.1 TIGR02221 family CRISPR-associated protein [Ectothiorhodospira lacustris]
MTTLLTFLGRAPRQEGRYRTTCYDFGDGMDAEPTAFFGWPLRRRLGAERLIIMGTSGSMWDHLFDDGVNLPEGDHLRLIQAVEEKRVTPDLLAPLTGPLADHLGCEVHLVLIPYCRTEKEQTDILSIMAHHVQANDRVHIDVTHGFRHLPMLALLAALYLRVARGASIDGIWYGAYDPDTGQAPVHNLIGLLGIADWLQTLNTYDKDGDYGAFAPLLGPAGEQLARAAFLERTNNPVKAREALTGWSSKPDRFPADDPAATLFRRELEQRVAWHKRRDRAAWEGALARQYLDREDYVRAAIFSLESVISAEVLRSGGQVNQYEDRETARDTLKHSAEGFRQLNHLRNALTHGLQAHDGKIERFLLDEIRLKRKLKELGERLGVFYH